jgi:hypothetical protein
MPPLRGGSANSIRRPLLQVGGFFGGAQRTNRDNLFSAASWRDVADWRERGERAGLVCPRSFSDSGDETSLKGSSPLISGCPARAGRKLAGLSRLSVVLRSLLTSESHPRLTDAGWLRLKVCSGWSNQQAATAKWSLGTLRPGRAQEPYHARGRGQCACCQPCCQQLVTD